MRPAPPAAGTGAAEAGYIGNTTSSVAGCCHSFSADGRCVTLLKVLMTNRCVYDCKYCVNRRSQRDAAGRLHPGGAGGPDHPVLPPQLHRGAVPLLRRAAAPGLHHGTDDPGAADLLREEYRFNGYIHAKAIPGAAPELVEQLGLLADRLSVNIELPSEAGLRTAGPGQDEAGHPGSHGADSGAGQQSREELVKYRHAPRFAPAGPEHPDDRGGHAGHGPPHPAADPGAV